MGEYYADYDEDSACWGIFHTDGPFCYALYAAEQEAEESAEKLNEDARYAKQLAECTVS
jgi:hypothetical protein